MSNVKPGDFAKIVHPQAGNDYGKVVHVERLTVNVPTIMVLNFGPIWWDCTMMSSMNAVVIRSGQVAEQHTKSPGSVLPFPDRHLRRVDPPEEPDQDGNEQESEEDREFTV